MPLLLFLDVGSVGWTSVGPISDQTGPLPLSIHLVFAVNSHRELFWWSLVRLISEAFSPVASGFFFHFAPSSPCSLSALQTAVAIHSFGDCPHSAAQLYRTSTSLFSGSRLLLRTVVLPSGPISARRTRRLPGRLRPCSSSSVRLLRRCTGRFPVLFPPCLSSFVAGRFMACRAGSLALFCVPGRPAPFPASAGASGSPFSNGPEKSVVYPAIYGSVPSVPGPAMSGCLNTVSSGSRSRATSFLGGMLAPIAPGFPAPFPRRSAPAGSRLFWVRLFFVGGPISLSGGGEAGGNWIRQGVVRSGRGSGGRRYFCRQRPMGDFRWSSRAS